MTTKLKPQQRRNRSTPESEMLRAFGADLEDGAMLKAARMIEAQVRRSGGPVLSPREASEGRPQLFTHARNLDDNESPACDGPREGACSPDPREVDCPRCKAILERERLAELAAEAAAS